MTLQCFQLLMKLNLRLLSKLLTTESRTKSRTSDDDDESTDDVATRDKDGDDPYQSQPKLRAPRRHYRSRGDVRRETTGMRAARPDNTTSTSQGRKGQTGQVKGQSSSAAATPVSILILEVMLRTLFLRPLIHVVFFTTNQIFLLTPK